MSVSAVANNNAASLRQADTKSASSKKSTETIAANAANSASTSRGTAAQSSTQVTLSPEAQILTQLAAEGITFTIADAQGNPVGPASIGAVTLPSRSSGESIDGYAMRVCSALSATGLNVAMTDPGGISMRISKITDSERSGTGDEILRIAKDHDDNIVPPTSGNQYDGEISQSAFKTVIQQMGGTTTEATQIFALFDTDHNASISNSDLLSGMSQLGSSAPGSPTQELLKLLVPAGDSTLTGNEFLSFESALVAVEKPAG